MIEKKTVLILGAGASNPYGFPTGRALALDICRKIEASDRPFMDALHEAGISQPLIGQFRYDLMESMQPSVDAFLENRPEFLEVGKAAIAASLIPCEQPSMIENRRQDIEWYEYLFHKLGPDEVSFRRSGLSVVTFNYDRSLEYFLYNALVHSFSAGPSLALELLSYVPIVHVYGSLGEPIFNTPDGRAYIPDLRARDLLNAAANILVAGEGNLVTERFETARRLTAQADVICFLGFAYHSANVRRLALPESPGPGLFGTAFHMGTNEVASAQKELPYEVAFGTFGEDCLAFLRNHAVFA